MKFKKSIAILSATVLALSLTFSVSAATKDDVISALKSDNISSTYVSMAQDFLKTYDLSAAQLDTVVANVDKVNTIMKDANVTDPTKLSTAEKNEVISVINETAAATGLTVSFGKDSKGVSYVKFVDSNGTPFEVSASDLGLKVTGSDNYGSYIVLALGLILAAAGAATMKSRKKVTE